MSQEEFIRDRLKTWEMSDCRPLMTPGESGTSVELPEEGTPQELDPDDIWRAQKLAGSLIWLSTRTGPDISYAQSRISSMATKAPKSALVEGLRLLRYFNGTRPVGLSFRACKNHEDVIAYTDAIYAVKRSQTR